MTKRDALSKKISTYQFAMLDLQLFLDTHPNDSATLEQMQHYQKLAEPLIEQYEEQYGPLTKRGESGNCWNWIKAPWPWECEEDS